MKYIRRHELTTESQFAPECCHRGTTESCRHRYANRNGAITRCVFSWLGAVLTLLVIVFADCHVAWAADWRVVYSESFDRIPAGTVTTSPELSQWEGGAAAGVVFDGNAKSVGRFLVASSAWTSFNQGPIFNLDLTAVPHDRVRVRCDLYTFGDWRGLQPATGGPLHRLMFFDSKATPRFAFDTNFATSRKFPQSWPQQSPAANEGLVGAQAVEADNTGRYQQAFRWPIEFDYPTDSPSLRFTVLCGAAAGSGLPMPPFGIDNVEVAVRSTAPIIVPADRSEQIQPMAARRPRPNETKIEFELPPVGRISVGIFDTTTGRLVRTLWSGERAREGWQTVIWDGCDNRGRSVAAGNYEWRSVTVPGFTARYVTTIGINPPGGEHPTPGRSWVGDHMGAGIVDVDESGVYIGSPMTEGLMMLAKVDATASKVAWRREQFYESGRLTKAATSGQHVFMVHPNGKLRRLNANTGQVEHEWQIAQENNAPVDVDARGRNLVVAVAQESKVQWLSVESGQQTAAATLATPRCVAAIQDTEGGQIVAASGRELFQLHSDGTTMKVATLSGNVVAMDYDPVRKELWAVVDGHRILRLDAEFRVQQTYGGQPREFGPYDPAQFAGIYDIASDLNGGFYIGEPHHPPRRIAHIARDGSVIEQWFGGMSFYVEGDFDPADNSRLIGIAPEGTVNVYRVDYSTGSWAIEETYSTGRLGDGMFPNAAAFRAIRRNGDLYLYHRVIPAVLRLDPVQRRAVPVAIAGRVLNRGRTFFQFAGSGRDGFPKPWVAGADHLGFGKLKDAPALYSWADTNGNGEFEPDEFRFYPNAIRGISFHNPGDYTANGDYVGSANTNETHALVRLPVSAWEGPRKDAPRWNWDQCGLAGEVIADSYGYGSPRGVCVTPDGHVTVAYQAGIMIREHGQYEGGGWPEAAMRGSRVLVFDSELKPMFAVGRQSKDHAEGDRGVLYYPLQTASGPNRTVVVNDQTKQPAQVWTHDGLYVGGFFDHRANDGRDDGFYRIHGDDNQGATVVTTSEGKTYWLMPYQGHNRLYEITGWTGWQRRSGQIEAPRRESGLTEEGIGLTARYFMGSKLVHETVEPPIFFEPFGAEPHAAKVKPHYKVVWTGIVIPPVTDRYEFVSLIGKDEQVAVWLDERVVHANGFATNDVSRPVELSRGHRHSMRVEYINPDGRAELKLLWRSRIIDPQKIPTTRLLAAP